MDLKKELLKPYNFWGLVGIVVIGMLWWAPWHDEEREKAEGVLALVKYAAQKEPEEACSMLLPLIKTLEASYEDLAREARQLALKLDCRL